MHRFPIANQGIVPSMANMKDVDVIIIGAGAAGLMCAITAGERGRSVLILDHASKPAEKIRISGGGRCNFTNLDVTAANYISQNSHFCKSALAGFSQWDFISWVSEAGISYHERDHGQLFCDHSAKDIIRMLLDKCNLHDVTIKMQTDIESVSREEGRFQVETSRGRFRSESLVVATGALSIPKMGATGLGHNIARDFGLNIVEMRPGLVPFTFSGKEKEQFAALAGISLPVSVSVADKKGLPSFSEAMLFTHRGISGPAMLQISSYWLPGDTLQVNLIPNLHLRDFIAEQVKQRPQAQLSTVLASCLPKRLVALLAEEFVMQQKIQNLSEKELGKLELYLQNWRIKPGSTEGYRTAEVTVGGVDTHDLDSKTMQAKSVDGLYFIGEVVDVTGHLGGYNFQWAWSSGYAAGKDV